MSHRGTIAAGVTLAAAVAVVVACGQPQMSVVAVPFSVQVDRGEVRPAGSSVGIVGAHPSLGATPAKPDGDPLKALKLRQTPDDKWVGAAWLPRGEAVEYVVYMLNPAAPEIYGSVLPDGGTEPVPDAGVVKRRVSWAGTEPDERPQVLVFDVPSNVTRPCVTFKVTVPANTPAADTIFIAGNDEQLGPWNPAKKALAKNTDGTYGTQLCFDPGKDLKYKYVRNGDWAYVEKNPDGSERPDRALTVTDTGPQNDTVDKWADL